VLNFFFFFFFVMTDLDRLSDHDTKQSGRLLPVLQRNVLPASSGPLVFGSFSNNTGYMIHIHVMAFMNPPIYSLRVPRSILYVIHILRNMRGFIYSTDTYCLLFIHLLVAYISDFI